MKTITLIITLSFMTACSHAYKEPVPRATDIDLDRFMGRWFVIANIPTFIEKGAHNAVESYLMNEDGSISTTFSFNEDSYDGDQKVYTPTGFVSNEDNSLWGMQFIWPFKAEYIIAYLSSDYQHTIIARSKRDYIWIMSRVPSVDDNTYQHLVKLSEEMGYDPKLIKKVPQKWNKSNYPSSGERS